MPLSDLTDEQLLAEYAGGKQDAFTVLFDRYQKMLVARLELSFPRKRHVADEATQRAFISLVRVNPAEVANVKAWLFKAIESEARMILREEWRHDKNVRFDHRSAGAGSPDGPTDFMADDSQTDPSEIASVNEQAAVLAASFDRLSSEDKRVVEAVYLRGLSTREAAEELDCPFNEIKVRLRRAYRELRCEISRKLVA